MDRSTYLRNAAEKKIGPFGVAAFVFGLLAVLICWIPLVNLLVIPLAGIGLVLGCVGLLIALVGHQRIGYPFVGIVLCVASVGAAMKVTRIAHKALVEARREVRAEAVRNAVERDRRITERERVKELAKERTALPATSPTIPPLPPGDGP